MYEVTIRKDGMLEQDEIVGKFRSKQEAYSCFNEYVMQGFKTDLHQVTYVTGAKYIKLIARKE